MAVGELNAGLEAASTWVAGVLGSGCAALLVLSVIGELLHRLGHPSVFTQWSAHVSPRWIRHCAGVVAGLLLTLIPIDVAAAKNNPAPRSGYATTTPIATQNDLEQRVTSTVATTTQPKLPASSELVSTTTTTTAPQKLPSESTSPPSKPIQAPTPINPSGTNTAEKQTSTTYEVQPSDCLWTIAAHVLGSQATNTTIDRYWRAIYATNKSLIGPNSNLIFSHQILILPPIN